MSMRESYWKKTPSPTTWFDQLGRPAEPYPNIPVPEFLGNPDQREVPMPTVIGVLADLSGTWDALGEVPEEHQCFRGEFKRRSFCELRLDNFTELMSCFRPRVDFKIVARKSGSDTQQVKLGFPCLRAFDLDWWDFKLQWDEKSSGIQSQTELRPTRGDPVPRLPLWGEESSAPVEPSPVEILPIPVAAPTPQKVWNACEEVIHHPEYLRLESTWRGLHRLLELTSSCPQVIVLVFNVRPSELIDLSTRSGSEGRDAFAHLGSLLQNAGTRPALSHHRFPFSMLVVDAFFSRSDQDLEGLQGLAELGASVQVPTLTGGHPSLIGLSQWSGPSAPGSDRIEPEDVALDRKWAMLRQAESAQFLVITASRFLARRLHGWGPGEPLRMPRCDGYLETASPANHESLPWANAAYLLAASLAGVGHSFQGQLGWTPQLELPCARRAVDGQIILVGPSEIDYSKELHASLEETGLAGFFNHPLSLNGQFASPPVLLRAGGANSVGHGNPEPRGKSLLLTYVASRCLHGLKRVCQHGLRSGLRRSAELQELLDIWIRKLSESKSATCWVADPIPILFAQLDSISGPDEYQSYHLRFRVGYEASLSRNVVLSARVGSECNS